MNNEQIIRRAYELAEKVDVKGWVDAFTSDGTFTDTSVGVTYRGPDGPTAWGRRSRSMRSVSRHASRAIPVFSASAMSSSWKLALQGTHKGPLRRLWESFRQPASGWTPRAVTSSAL